MEVITYLRLMETIYYEQLTNGLQVYIIAKPGFHKTYAVFSAKYGSVDNHFQVEGEQEVRVPDGIAHFLEHKMFEEPTGDVFAQFSSLGASANAFTSFDRTAYLFSATEHIHENLTTLINFVQNPYFTDENVEKEKGIIGQEIKMYEDNPDWRCYFGLIEAMYQIHPVHIDIAGTVESISQITKETLYKCYHTFYHPSNMNLFVVGGVEPEQLMQLIRSNQESKDYGAQGEIHRYFADEPLEVRQKKREVTLPVSIPKCLIGLKEQQSGLDGKELLIKECTTKLVLDVLFGPSSAIYQALYDENLISDSFGHEYNCNSDYAFSIIGGDTKDPELLIQRIRQEIDSRLISGLDIADFDRSKKKKIGGFLRMLNSPEAIANEFTKYRFKNSNLFDILPTYEAMTLDDANKRMREHFQWDQAAISIVKSEVSEQRI